MIIDHNIKKLVARLEKDGVNAPDDIVRELVTRLTEACARPENRKRYEIDPATQSKLGFYPVDSEGYAVAFDALENEEDFVSAWQRYGIVVGKSLLSPAQCGEAVKHIKERFNAISSGKCDLDKPETWRNMPQDANGTPLLTRGFLEIYHDDMLAQIRQNVRAYIHHVLIWGRADLWTSFDRLGVKLPHHEESKGLPLHVDQNPNVHPGFKTVQGVLALVDCPVERGTFMGVPGSRNFFRHYAEMARNKGEYVEFDATAPVAQELLVHAQPIALRAGNYVSWDSRTLHANTENTSDKTRIVMYMAAGPARQDDPAAVAARMEALKTGEGLNVREALMHASKKPRYTSLETLAAVRRPEQLTLLGKLLYGTERYEKVAAAPAP